MGNNLLTRDQILSKNELPREIVPVPEWGGSVCVQGLTAERRDLLEIEISEAGKEKGQMRLKNFRSRILALTVVDENGIQVFGDTDVNALGETSAAAVERVFDVAVRLSGMSSDEDDTEGEEE